MSAKESRKAPAAKKYPIVVEVMNGPEDGREIVCNKTPITIGRSNENSVSLTCDHLISRCHARVAKSGDEFKLKDLGSTNGTFIGKKRIREKSVPVKSDELFRVGATLLRIKLRPTEVSPA